MVSLGGGGGGGTSQGRGSTIQQTTPTSPESQELIKMQLAAAKQAAADDAAYRGSPDYALDQQMSRASKQNILDRVTGKAPVISPEAQAQIDAAYGHTQASGLRDINQTMQQDANARGLSATDSPVANAKGLALGEFESGLGSAKAQSALNLGNTNAIFNQSLSQFQDQLRLNSAMNRMSVQSGYTNPAVAWGLGTADKYSNQRGMNTYSNWSLGGGLGTGGAG